LRGYDSHFIIRKAYEISKGFNQNINVIPNSYEKFMSFSIGDLKFIDSLLGSLLSTARTAFIAYLLAVILVSTPWSFGDKHIATSKFYTYTDSHLPKVITDLKTQADKLFKGLN
jgi:hypothetical protein